MTRGVLWDSSAILALLDADDADHQHAVGVARQIARERRPSFITNYIEADAHALLLRKLRLASGCWPATSRSSRSFPPRNNARKRSWRDTSTRTAPCATRSRLA